MSKASSASRTYIKSHSSTTLTAKQLDQEVKKLKRGQLAGYLVKRDFSRQVCRDLINSENKKFDCYCDGQLIPVHDQLDTYGIYDYQATLHGQPCIAPTSTSRSQVKSTSLVSSAKKTSSIVGQSEKSILQATSSEKPCLSASPATATITVTKTQTQTVTVSQAYTKIITQIQSQKCSEVEPTKTKSQTLSRWSTPAKIPSSVLYLSSSATPELRLPTAELAPSFLTPVTPRTPPIHRFDLISFGLGIIPGFMLFTVLACTVWAGKRVKAVLAEKHSYQPRIGRPMLQNLPSEAVITNATPILPTHAQNAPSAPPASASQLQEFALDNATPTNLPANPNLLLDGSVTPITRL